MAIIDPCETLTSPSFEVKLDVIASVSAVQVRWISPQALLDACAVAAPKTMKRIVSAEVNTVLIFSPPKLFDFIFLGLSIRGTATLSAWAALPGTAVSASTPALGQRLPADARSLQLYFGQSSDVTLAGGMMFSEPQSVEA